MAEEEPGTEQKPSDSYKCKYCGTEFDALHKLGNHVKNECEKAKEAKSAAQEERVPTSIYKGETDQNLVLREILAAHPDIKEQHVKEVMSWAEMSGGLHPSQVIYLLSSMKGVDTKTANMIAQKYSLALYNAQREKGSQFQGTPMLPGQPTPSNQGGMLMAPSMQQQPFTWPQFQPPQMQLGPSSQAGLYTQQDIQKMREDWVKEERLKKVEDSLGDLRKDLPNLIKDAIPQTQGSQDFEEVTEYVDKDGKMTRPEDAISVRTIRKPIQHSDLEDKAIDRLLKYKEAFGPNLDESKIRNIIREERGDKEKESPEVTALKEHLATSTSALEKMNQKFEDFKDQMSEKDKEEMRNSMTELRTQITNLGGQIRAGGVNSPEGVLATAVTTVGSREPIKVIVEGAKSLLGTPGIQPQPPPQPAVPAGPEQRRGVLQALDEKGLVTRIRERVAA